MNDSPATTLSRLQALLARNFDRELAALQPAVSLEDLDIDSLRMIEILFEVEDAFKISVPVDQAELRAKVKTVGDLATYVDALVAGQHGAGEGRATP